ARQPAVTSLVLDGLQELADQFQTGPFVTADWTNLMTFVIRPLLDTPRDARRYLQSLSLTLRLIGDEIALPDLLALEAVRILRPEMFGAIVACADALTSTEPRGPGYMSKEGLQATPVWPMI